MLVKAGIEEYPVLANRSPQSAAELLLAIIGLGGGIRLLSVEGTVAEVIERGAMPLVAARLGHYVEYGAASPAEFGAVGVRRYTELLDDFVAELIRGTIAAPRLGVKRVVVVSTINQEVVLEATHAAKSQVAVGVRGQTPRILGYTRCQQRQVGKAAAVQRQVRDCLLRNHI